MKLHWPGNSMLSSKQRVQGSSPVEGPLWGARARDWADIQERTAAPLYKAVILKTRLGSRTRLLDIGCGSGVFCALAAKSGAIISGLDAARSLIAVAAERTPHGDFRVAEMEDLPYADKSFDLVTGLDSFAYAADPLNALQEARRVARGGAQIVAATWGPPQDCQAAAYVDAVGSLMPPSAHGETGPFALSGEGALTALLRQAGLTPVYADEVECVWEYPDLETALKGLLSAGPAVKAIQTSGDQKVREAVVIAIAPFQQSSGSYRLKNQFRYVIALRPQ